jgi:hypothetical protein
MFSVLRIAVYVVGGGALLAWIQPRNGLLQAALILGLIGVFAGMDRLLTGMAGGGRTKANNPSGSRRGPGLSASRAHRSGKGLFGPKPSAEARAANERRALRSLHTTSDLDEAEALLEQLRDRKLHPMLVTQRAAAEGDAIRYEVRLPESEWPRAHTVLTRFSTRRAES